MTNDPHQQFMDEEFDMLCKRIVGMDVSDIRYEFMLPESEDVLQTLPPVMHDAFLRIQRWNVEMIKTGRPRAYREAVIDEYLEANYADVVRYSRAASAAIRADIDDRSFLRHPAMYVEFYDEAAPGTFSLHSLKCGLTRALDCY